MEDKQYKELTYFIGGQFNEVWKRFDVVDERLGSLEFQFGDLKKDFRQLQSSVDAYAAKADKYFMELAALGNKVDRLEKWINFIAEKTGIKLPS